MFLVQQCTGIYLIVYGLRTLLPDNHESSITFRNNELFEEFIFQHKAKPIFIVLGYITFFIPLIGCWAIILNRTRVLMIVCIFNYSMIIHQYFQFNFLFLVHIVQVSVVLKKKPNICITCFQYILCLLLEIMGMTIIMSDFLSIHIPTQNEDQVFIDETEVLKMYYDNFYTVDIARGTINQIQTTVGRKIDHGIYRY